MVRIVSVASLGTDFVPYEDNAVDGVSYNDLRREEGISERRATVAAEAMAEPKPASKVSLGRKADTRSIGE